MSRRNKPRSHKNKQSNMLAWDEHIIIKDGPNGGIDIYKNKNMRRLNFQSGIDAWGWWESKGLRHANKKFIRKVSYDYDRFNLVTK